jgi:hypothetical protein
MRWSGRKPLDVPILLLGRESEGRVFAAQTKTMVMSLLVPASCFATHWSPNGMLRSLKSGRESEIRLGGVLASPGRLLHL